MKKGLLHRVFCLPAVLLISTATSPYALADADVYWDFDGGFDPSTVTINPGERVYWTNLDIFGFDFLLTVQGYQPIVLEQFETAGAQFNVPGTYSFTSDYGDFGSVIVNNPQPQTILLSAPRLVDGEFQFDVEGLTAGLTHVVEKSTNLTSWTGIATNVATSATATITNTPTPGRQFYRIFEAP
jgi:plastocyanin